MNNDTMNNDVHERARQLIALSGSAPQSSGQSSHQSSSAWLAAHLETCASCRAFAANAAESIRALRAIPIAAGRSLVSTTQLRVRHRALELLHYRERLWLVAVCCVAVAFSALVSTFALWRGFEWIAARTHLASSVWQLAFLVFCVMPTLITAILLLAKDTHLPHQTGSYRG
jgi:predicted anti-sigma-YlaC factor YlaD